MINTVGKFLDASGFARGTNHPSIEALVFKLIELKATDHTLVDIISFFLYDGESIDDALENFKRIEYKQLIEYQADKTAENWEKLLDTRNKGGVIESFVERLNNIQY